MKLKAGNLSWRLVKSFSATESIKLIFFKKIKISLKIGSIKKEKGIKLFF